VKCIVYRIYAASLVRGLDHVRQIINLRLVQFHIEQVCTSSTMNNKHHTPKSVRPSTRLNYSPIINPSPQNQTPTKTPLSQSFKLKSRRLHIRPYYRSTVPYTQHQTTIHPEPDQDERKGKKRREETHILITEAKVVDSSRSQVVGHVDGSYTDPVC